MNKIITSYILITFTIILVIAVQTLYKKAHTPLSNNINLAEIINGDIIFQTSLSAQSKAIQLATHSKFSHCGIIFKEDSSYYVYEATQPVKKTPLQHWISRGQNKTFAIKRLKNEVHILTNNEIINMKNIANSFIGKNYDLSFSWSDDKIYCSELIWKIYQSAIGIEIGKLEKMKDLDLTNQVVKEKLNARYGNKIPWNDTVITPKAIFECNQLQTMQINE